jgi:hypothetical protein
VVELVDTLDSKSGFFGSAGSSPATGTNECSRALVVVDFRGFFVPKQPIVVTFVVTLGTFIGGRGAVVSL